jgi:hypothetical protein
VETPGEGSSRIDFTSRIDLTALRRKDRIKARKADGAELRDWPPRAFTESPYKLRSKSKALVKRTEFSNCRRTQGPPSRVLSSHFWLVSGAGAATPFLIYIRAFAHIIPKIKAAY